MNTDSFSKFDVVLSINVRGISDRIKRSSIFSYLKDKKSKHLFFTRNIFRTNWINISGEKNGVVSYFSHMAPPTLYYMLKPLSRSLNRRWRNATALD